MQKSESKKLETAKVSGKALITGVLSADSLIIKQIGGEEPYEGIVHLAWI
jgi:hypothetical protein